MLLKIDRYRVQGLFLNIKKTKIMNIDKCKKKARIAINGE